MTALVELTTTEVERLTVLETTIERGLQTFVEVGNALMEIRDTPKFYRSQYETFENYCQKRWGFTDRRARQLMSAAEVVMNIQTGTIVPVLPQTESQTRPLTKLTPQLQRTVWPIVVDTAPNGNITANHIERTIDNFLSPDLDINAALADEDNPVCPDCGQVYDGDGCPDCEIKINGYNYKRDNRRSQVSNIYTPQGMDACQTPAYALDPLLPYLPRHWAIWEPACGEGLLEDALYDSGFSTLASGDILIGQNFFDYEPEEWDCIITNPPYSIQFQWLERCYKLGKPFALLLKVEILGTKTAQEMFAEFGIQVIFVSPRINFKMPHKGWGGGGAQFPTAWFTYGLNIGQQMKFAKVVPDAN